MAIEEFIALSIIAGLLCNLITDIYRLVGRKVASTFQARNLPNNVVAIA